jgi:hypothetical protein
VNWADFKAVASFIGIPGAMMAVLVWSLSKGWFVTGREFDRLVAEYVRMTKERDDWKDIALKSWQQAERFAETTARAHEATVKAVDGKK